MGATFLLIYIIIHFHCHNLKSAAVTTKMRLSNHLLCFHLQDMEFGMAIRKTNAERPRFRAGLVLDKHTALRCEVRRRR